jgi:hypothetical protein
MPFRGRSFGRSRSVRSLAFRQGGTGATFSGSQSIIRHSNTKTVTIASGETQAFNLVAYNPTNHGTPVALDGSSTKVLTNNFTAKGSRVDFVTVQLTVKQTDTSKNNTVYVGTISTSFNEGRLNSALMTTNFNDFINSDETAGHEGEMDVDANAKTYSLHNYSLKDVQQHHIRGLLRSKLSLYGGRVVSSNTTIPLPRKNRRQQEGSIYALVIMNDSENDTAGSDVEVRIDTFFKEIPVNSI